jgi:hypothetical protein
MVSVFCGLRKAAFALAALVGLAACEPMPMAGGGPRIDADAPIPVALLLPSGSGQAGDEILARSLENAARLAIADLQGVSIDLRVYATGASSQQAAASAVQAVNEGAKIILGPVFADAANAAGVAVASRNVNVISFSNNAEIAGGNVFVLGTTFANTAGRLVSYAARQGKGAIYVVHEQTPAGQIGLRAVETAIARSSARLAGSQSYAFSQEGVVAAVPSIVAGVRGSGAQSLFLTADSAGALPLFAQLLPESGLTPATLQYIGLTRWDIPPATLSLPGVQGGWFALPDPALNSQFQARYAAAYGTAPHPIAGLAYDGIAAIGALARSRGAEALTASALTQPSGFVGVSGIFRFRTDGTNERGLAVAEIRNNQVVVIDPAPRSFAAAGF